MNTITRLAVGIWLACSPIALACRIIPVPPPTPRPEPPPRIEPMQTRVHRAEIVVSGPVARVEVEAVFFNPGSQRIEGEYFFPIEPDAVVHDFTMTVNDREMKAELLDADRARRIYEDIVRRQRDPALLEWVGSRMLRARIFPIEPRSEVRIRLAYTQLVRTEGGAFRLRYPLRSAKPGSGSIDQLAVRLTLRGDTPIRWFYSPTHALEIRHRSETEVVAGFEQTAATADRDVEVYWTLNRAPVDVSVVTWKPRDDDGYFLLALSPQLRCDPGRSVPKDIVFVLDRSGSMSGEKIRQARDALCFCLERLEPSDRFAVVTFSSDVERWSNELQPATREAVREACGRAAQLQGTGGTAIHDALLSALSLLQNSRRLAILVFLTDGQPTVGPTDPDEILRAVRRANPAGVRLFVFGVGHDVNTYLLDRLAADHNGLQQYVRENENLEQKLSAFYQSIAQPMLTDVTIQADGVELRDLYPRQIPDVFAGSDIVVFGRYRGHGRHRVVIRGLVDGREQTFSTGVDWDGHPNARFIPELWAYRKVAFLLEEIRLRGQNPELQAEIEALGRRYGILTPYTSFLVTEDQSPRVAEHLERYREKFATGAVIGETAVGFSRRLADAKMAVAPLAAAPASDVLVAGFDRDLHTGELRAELPEVARAVERVRRVADKVFVLHKDGFYYDTSFEESLRNRMIEVRRFSDEYFALLDRHPGMGQFLAVPWNLVVVVDGQAYRICD